MAPASQRVRVSVQKAEQIEAQLNTMGVQEVINYAEYHYNGKHTHLKLEFESTPWIKPRLTRYGGTPYSALSILLDDNTKANALNNILEPALGTWAKVFRKCKHYNVGNGDFVQIDEIDGLSDRYVLVYVDGNTGHALNELDYYMQLFGIINNPNVTKPYAYIVAGP